MKQSGLFEFSARCLALDGQPEFASVAREAFLTGTVNTDDFIRFCSNELVLPAIYLKLKNHQLLDCFPADYVTEIAALYLRNAKRNTEILKQVSEINSKFRSHAIQAVFLKGTANLLDKLYADSGERMIGDIDLLVPDVDFLKAAGLVMELGYAHEGPVYDDVTRQKDYPRLFRADVPADIEIHRLPVYEKFGRRFAPGLIFDDKRSVPGFDCFIPSAEHRAIHNYIHAHLVDKGHLYRIVRLRDLYDFFLLSKKVNLQALLPEIENRKGAETFSGMAEKLFGNSGSQHIAPAKTFRRFYRQHAWFLNHPGYHRLFIGLIKLYELVAIRYFFRLANAVFNKSSRQYIFNRLKDPAWYRHHINGLRNSF